MSRPDPFEHGNELSMKPGRPVVLSRSSTAPGRTAAVAPWTTVGLRRHGRAWATAEARSRLLGEYLDERGLLDGAGVPLPAVALAERFERQAATLRAQLALTPMTWAQLRRTTADIDGGDVIDIKAGLRDAGRRILEAEGGRAGRGDRARWGDE